MAVPVLDRRLTLEEPQDVPDGAGGSQRTWVALGELWAELRPGTGRERAVESVTVAAAAYRITVRAAPPGAASRPRADQRFREGSRLFRILAVTDRDDRGRYLTCFATEEVAA